MKDNHLKLTEDFHKLTDKERTNIVEDMERQRKATPLKPRRSTKGVVEDFSQSFGRITKEVRNHSHSYPFALLNCA